MLQTEFLVADLAFHGLVRARPDEQEFNEIHGWEPSEPQALDYIPGVVRRAARWVRQTPRHPRLGERADVCS